MTTLIEQYEKGCSPSSLQHKYKLTYEQGFELVQRLKKTQALELEVRRENAKLKELLKEWLLFEKEENPHDFTIMSERMEELAKQTKEFLGDNNE